MYMLLKMLPFNLKLVFLHICFIREQLVHPLFATISSLGFLYLMVSPQIKALLYNDNWMIPPPKKKLNNNNKFGKVRKFNNSLPTLPFPSWNGCMFSNWLWINAANNKIELKMLFYFSGHYWCVIKKTEITFNHLCNIYHFNNSYLFYVTQQYRKAGMY